MAAASAPAKSQYRLYTRAVSIIGLLTVFASFVEADQRGLVFRSDDLALLAGEADVAGVAGPIASISQYGLNRSDGRNRATGNRPTTQISPVVFPGATDEITGPTSGGASRILEQPTTQDQLPQAVQTSTSAPASRSGTQPSSGPGFPASPIGLVAVNTNPGPVVPAVPEPASWLLMIIGVGWLGLSLRRREDKAEAQERHVVQVACSPR